MFKPLLNSMGRAAHLSSAVPPLDMPDTVDVRGTPRVLHVRTHARAKRMILRFDPRSGEGKLTVPKGVPASAAWTFLSQSASWIDRHAPPQSGDADGPKRPETVAFHGIPHRIIPTGRVRGTVTRGSDPHRPEFLVPGTPHRIMPRLQGFLKNEAERVLTPQVMTLAGKLGKRPSSVRYRDPKSQWGSCSSNRTITLSWRVIMAPPEAQSYLIAHEVAHLAQMNHSAAFWQTVASLYPEWKTGQRALKHVEKALLSIDFS